MLNVNQKFDTIIDVLEETLDKDKKLIPKKYQDLYKSSIKSLRIMLLIAPDKKVKEYENKMTSLFELLKQEHETKASLKSEIEKLVTSWT